MAASTSRSPYLRRPTLRPRGHRRHHPLEQIPQLIRHQTLHDPHGHRIANQPNETNSEGTTETDWGAVHRSAHILCSGVAARFLDMTAQIQLDPMSDSEYEQFAAESVRGYAEEKAQAGTWSREEALDRAQEEFDLLLPQGVASPDNYLFTVRDARSQQSVGRLWFAMRGELGRREAYVYEVAVDESHRGKGYGRAAMVACVEEARKVGANSVGLHVFGGNKIARSLYTSLGFAEVGVMMSLPLDVP